MSPENFSLVQELKRVIRNGMNELTDALAIGGAKDWADYQKQTGIIMGLAMAERELLDLLARAEKAEND